MPGSCAISARSSIIPAPPYSIACSALVPVHPPDELGRVYGNGCVANLERFETDAREVKRRAAQAFPRSRLARLRAALSDATAAESEDASTGRRGRPRA
jgi:hypothetical protein